MTAWIVATVAWVALHAYIAWRSYDRSDVDLHSATPPDDPPLVSVIVPARDEARSIARCVSSILASEWPRLELVVVDDHSTDGTGELARAAARGDDRLRVIVPPPLPDGWFGKQWACHTGAQSARGALLCFTDADTTHGPELLTRSVNALVARGTDLFSVGGRQELGSFWEKVIQPFVFATLIARFAGMERMSRSTRPRDKIANGQYILVRRDTYSAEGGHEAVRTNVAEDLQLAQRWTAHGRAVHMMWAQRHLATRMYTSFDELRRGWGKNVFAAGRDAVADSRALRALFPVLLPLSSLIRILPFILLPLALAGVLGSGALWFGAVAGGATMLYWLGVYRAAGLNPFWALTLPLAAVAFAFICAEAAIKGSRVEWKGRKYVSHPS